MKRLQLLLAALIFVLPQAKAQNAIPLTLESAVQTAVERNVNVLQARNSVVAAESNTRVAVADYFPDLSLNGGYSQQQNWKNDPAGVTYYQGIPISTGGASYSRFDNYRTGLSTNVLLFNGFATAHNVTRSRANADVAEYSLTRTSQTTIFQTHQLYLNVVRSFQLMKVSEENLKRSQRQLERITESNKVGAVALADVYRQQVQAGSDELALIQAQSNYEKAKADVLAFLGVELDREYVFDFTGIPTDIDTAEFGPLNQQYANFNGLISTAVNQRPDHLSAMSSLSGSEASVSAAKAAYFPTISGQASYSYSNDALSTLKDNRSLGLSLNISLPIFNGFQTQNQIQQAEIQQSNAQQNLEQSKRQLTVDIRKALLDLEAAEKQIRVTQASVRSAEMDRTIAEEKYNLGSSTLLDLLIANANYTQALSNKVNAVNDYLLAKKGVEFALGTISR